MKNLKQPSNEIDFGGEEVALLPSLPFSLTDTWQNYISLLNLFTWNWQNYGILICVLCMYLELNLVISWIWIWHNRRLAQVWTCSKWPGLEEVWQGAREGPWTHSHLDQDLHRSQFGRIWRRTKHYFKRDLRSTWRVPPCQDREGSCNWALPWTGWGCRCPCSGWKT